MDRIRVEAFPILLQIPWGISLYGMPSLPLPAKITVQICEPLDWSMYGAKSADNPRVVQECYDQITGVMQNTLSDLAERIRIRYSPGCEASSRSPSRLSG